MVDGRESLIKELELADPFLRNYVSSRIGEWLTDESFRDALPGHLPGDAASQGRLPSLLDRLQAISGL